MIGMSRYIVLIYLLTDCAVWCALRPKNAKVMGVIKATNFLIGIYVAKEKEKNNKQQMTRQAN